MIRVGLGTMALRNIRVGYSPLGELTASIRARAHPGAFGALARRRTATEAALLAALLAPGAPFPTALGPGPDRAEEALEVELHRLARTDGETFSASVRRMLDDGRLATPSLPVAPDHLRRFLDRTGPALPGVVADLLDSYDELVFRRLWPQVRARLEVDLSGRAAVLLGQGADGLLHGLSRHAVWNGEQLLLDKPFVEDLGTVSGLVLVPSQFLSGAPTVAVDEARIVTIRYGARRSWTGEPDPGRALHALLGDTRAELLLGLAAPTHTHELAARHNLSPSTVSHHLQVLRRAGLVNSARHSRRVFYHRTDLGNAVVRGRGAPAAPT